MFTKAAVVRPAYVRTVFVTASLACKVVITPAFRV